VIEALARGAAARGRQREGARGQEHLILNVDEVLAIIEEEAIK
jgi:hypothetical protein